MSSVWLLILFAHLLITDRSMVEAFHSGAPCLAQFSLEPSTVFHGKSQDLVANPPPFSLDVTDTNGQTVTSYKEGIYKLRLTANDQKAVFRGFLIQARPATADGLPIGHLRAGVFVPDLTWSSQGIQIQPCPNVYNDSVTHSNGNDRNILEILWKPLRNYGPIVFSITIVQSRHLFWSRWVPTSGVLYPEIDSKFVDPLTNGKQIDQSINRLRGPATTKSAVDVDQITTEEIFTNQPPIDGVVVTTDQSEIDQSPNEEYTIGQTPVDETAIVGESSLSTAIPLPPAVNIDQESFEESDNLRVKSLKELELNFFAATPPSESKLRLRTPAQINLAPLPDSEQIDEAIDLLLNRTVVFVDYCTGEPCANGGNCTNIPDEERFECTCTERWIGEFCSVPNTCFENGCENGAECIVEDDSYSCNCRRDWSGQFCDKPCPSDICHNGGSCIIDPAGSFGCSCVPGFKGDHCEIEIDHCIPNPCLNEGKCVRHRNGFECRCPDGYMGKTCQRPCQDIYRSCDFWGQQDRCESQRPTTQWFDVNCAVTCQQCVHDNKTVIKQITLPPAMERFEFLLGSWTINSTSGQRFPVDFGANYSSAGYLEVIRFELADVPQFGPPSINYTSYAVSNTDPDEVYVTVGFLTLKPATVPLEIFLLTSGNDALTVVESGVLIDEELRLTVQESFVFSDQEKDSQISNQTSRVFTAVNGFLRETVDRTWSNGRHEFFTKYYRQEEKVVPF